MVETRKIQTGSNLIFSVKEILLPFSFKIYLKLIMDNCDMAAYNGHMGNGVLDALKLSNSQMKVSIRKMVGDVLAMIDDQIACTTGRVCGQSRQLFLALKEQQRALIRPLLDLNSATAFAIHNRYYPDIKRKVYVVCAREINKPCYYCQRSGREEQYCSAEVSFMLPIFVYSLIDTRSGRQIMQRDRAGLEQPIEGLRLLELTAFGAVRDVLATFSTFVHAGGNISGCDWTLEQFVGAQGRLIVTTPRPLKPLSPQLEALIPPKDLVRRRILEFAPPIPYTA